MTPAAHCGNVARMPARRAAKNHHNRPDEHRYGDPLGVYMPPLAEWGRWKQGQKAVLFWTHPTLGWAFRIVGQRSPQGFVALPDTHAWGLRRHGIDERPVFAGRTPDAVYAAMKRWYASIPLDALAYSENVGGRHVTRYFGAAHGFTRSAVRGSEKNPAGSTTTLGVWDGLRYADRRLRDGHRAAIVSSYSRAGNVLDENSGSIGYELVLRDAMDAQDADETGRVYVWHDGAWRATDRKPNVG